jgi:hypothetical protein
MGIGFMASKANWLASKWNSTPRYYGEKYSGFLGMGKAELSLAFNSYSGDLRDIVHSLI